MFGKRHTSNFNKEFFIGIAAGICVVAAVLGLVYGGYSFTKKNLRTSSSVSSAQSARRTVVSSIVSSVASTTPQPQPVTPSPASDKAQYTIVIDAGHQKNANNTPEPIGPGASETKPAVASGTQGSYTHVPEYKVNLIVARKLQKLLKEKGFEVIMIRTANDVNIPNSKRAKIANNAHAKLLIRLHCDGAASRKVAGYLTVIPSRNRWTGAIVGDSMRAGKTIHAAVLVATGAKDRGINAVGNMSGFNWSKVPVVICEMGVMTNKVDDYNLSNDSYQNKLARGLAAGIVTYVEEK